MSMTSDTGIDPALAEEKRRSRWIPWTFVGGFGVIIAVNAVLVVFSLSSWTGLETEDAYNKGIAYNEVLAAAEAQSARGWSAAMAYEAGSVEVTLTDKSGAGIAGLTVTAALIRPTHEGYDQTVTLAEVGMGRYAAPVTMPLAGNWDVRVRAEGRGEPWYQTQRIWVK